MRGNKCYRNRRAGIGIRMESTAPVVEANECYENEMAGIGCRDGATPILRNNNCHNNKMAGIGCNGAKPLIVANECRENEQAGIGMQGKGMATIQSNKCIDNKLVAIGVTQESTATITDNELSRTGGVPPIIAVKDGSSATIRDNRIAGGGVAALLVQGKATVSGNTFAGAGAKQGNAIWVWENSMASITDNAFDGYRAAVNATKATVVITGNTVKQFQGTAIIVKDSQKPAQVYGNTATSADPKAKAVDVQGPSGVVADNTVKKE
jgi:parallel beta-helix repeat protein